MRSTRGKTRAYRAQARQHYTEAGHASVPARSNAPSHEPKPVRNADHRARMRAWGTMNTNTQLSRGGISSYHRPREGKGQ